MKSMSLWRLAGRSLFHHARAHVGAAAGTLVAAAVLVGALSVGDSVRGSLRDMALHRLGTVEEVLVGNDRIFRSALGEEPGGTAVLVTQAVATGADGKTRANAVHVHGVDSGFWNLAPRPHQPGLGPGEVILNQRLARQLEAKEGDSILLRLTRFSELSGDAPLSPVEDASVASRVRVRSIVDREEFGDFGLQASQIPPRNAFVSRQWLEKVLEREGGANLLLFGANGGRDVMQELRSRWSLADAQLELRPLEAGFELRTERVFLDPSTVAAAREAIGEGYGVLTWFVNRLEVEGRTTPYSMVSAAPPPLTPEDMEEDGVVINRWLAEDLQAGPGDRLTMKYYVVGRGRELVERSEEFVIHSVCEVEGIHGDPGLMPDFPGLADAENCRDWDTGLPIDTEAIRDKDNLYWEEHRGTPKAFVHPATGARLWHNRFGDLTALRFSADGIDRESWEAKLAGAIDPASLGLTVVPVREDALASVQQSQDFGGLFIGFSFFLVLASVILISLLFHLGMEQRRRQTGILLTLGLRPGPVRRLLYLEGALVSVVGTLIGALCGMLYARAMLYGLSTLWRDAVGTSSLEFHYRTGTLLLGALGGLLVAWLTMARAARGQTLRPARDLLQDGADAMPVTGAIRWWGIAFPFAAACALIAWALGTGEGEVPLFFGAGALLLFSGMMGARGCLMLWAAGGGGGRPGMIAMGLRGSTRRIRRSVATIGLLACGSFLVVSVGANRLDALRDAGERSSGTGGFGFWGETTRTVVHDLDSPEGREFHLLDDPALGQVRFVPFRVLPGEDASCLNLNRAQRPRLLGVDPADLAGRRSFTFASTDREVEGSPWNLLSEKREDGAVPAVMDANSMRWALGKGIGDRLRYTDSRGETFEIVLVGALVNSILQGSLVISEDAFVERWPFRSGYQAFLVDCPPEDRDRAAPVLVRGLEDAGLELVPAEERLADFNAVQNTYLSTFQLLGGLGLILGSVGLGVVVLRNVGERRGELALLQAVGFRMGSLRQMVLCEHGALLLAGLVLGTGTALVATLPALLSPGAGIPWVSLAWTLAAVVVNGWLWTWIAARNALAEPLLEALRHE